MNIEEELILERKVPTICCKTPTPILEKCRNVSTLSHFTHLNINCDRSAERTSDNGLTTGSDQGGSSHRMISADITSSSLPTHAGGQRSGGKFPYLIRCLGHNVRRHQLPESAVSPGARPGHLPPIKN